MSVEISLGVEGYSYHFVRWEPDREIPENAQRFFGINDEPRYGITITHPKGPTGCECEWTGTYRSLLDDPEKRGPFLCMSMVTFRGPTQQAVEPQRENVWDVQSYEPLTIHPSVLCHCGAHGWIRDGIWVPA